MIDAVKKTHAGPDGVADASMQTTGVVVRPLRAVIALSAVERNDFFAGDRASRLEALLPGFVWLEPADVSPETWSARLASIKPQVLVTGWQTPALPPETDGLQYVCHLTGSVRRIVPRSLLAGGLTVTNWGNICAPLVAEHALLLILGSLRSIPKWPAAMDGQFTQGQKNQLGLRSLHGRRVRIHGFGRIARELVRLLRPFTVDIRAYSAGVPAEVMTALGVCPAVSLEGLASDADVFVTCEALTDATTRSIDRAVLSALPMASVFVNVGRGAVVDEAALADVAVERQLRVASDVFVEEPLPADSPLRAIPNALYSPHVAGQTEDLYRACGDLALVNIGRFLTGQPLRNRLTLDAYDRST